MQTKIYYDINQRLKNLTLEPPHSHCAWMEKSYS